MVTFRKTSNFANRGKGAEDAVNKALVAWVNGSAHREFSRLVDSKAAGRTIKAAAADFEFFTAAGAVHFGLIEVKETEHKYRLNRDKVPQLARLRKRTKCGGICLVLIHHSTLKKWRLAYAEVLAVSGDKGSWNLAEYPLFDTPHEALSKSLPQVFP